MHVRLGDHGIEEVVHLVNVNRHAWFLLDLVLPLDKVRKRREAVSSHDRLPCAYGHEFGPGHYRHVPSDVLRADSLFRVDLDVL